MEVYILKNWRKEVEIEKRIKYQLTGYPFKYREIFKKILPNYDNNEKLKETRSEINTLLKELNKDDKYLISNLKFWLKKYDCKINSGKELYDEFFSGSKEYHLETLVVKYISINGISLSGLKLDKKYLIKEKKLNIGSMDFYYDEPDKQKYIIEIKKGDARATVIGQVLSYRESILQQENIKAQIIIVAGGFSKQYRYAAESIKNLGLNIIELQYLLPSSGIIIKYYES